MRNSISRAKYCLELEQLEDRLVLSSPSSFVTSLYVNLLGRQPGATELPGWVNMISSGVTYQQIATDIWDSVEHRTDQVDAYYVNYLHRAPDPAGESGWILALETGYLNEQGVKTGFLTSNEYLNDYPTPQAYVNALYLNILGRNPQPAEELQWVSILQQTSNTYVVAALLTSTESYTRIVTAYYQSWLLRAPDAAGLQGWLNSLQSGFSTLESVAESILGSTEYANKH